MLLNTSVMVDEQPEAQAPLPITLPVVMADDQTKEVPVIVEFRGKLLGSPLQMVMLEAEPTGAECTALFASLQSVPNEVAEYPVGNVAPVHTETKLPTV